MQSTPDLAASSRPVPPSAGPHAHLTPPRHAFNRAFRPSSDLPPPSGTEDLTHSLPFPGFPDHLAFIIPFLHPRADLHDAVQFAMQEAEQQGQPLDQVLISSGLIFEERFYRALALHLGVPYEGSPHLHARHLSSPFTRPEAIAKANLAMVDSQEGQAHMVIAPNGAGIKAAGTLCRTTGGRRRVRITRPSLLRGVLAALKGHDTVREAIGILHVSRPDFSAKVPALPLQLLLLLLTFASTVLAIFAYPQTSWLALDLLVTLFFFLVIAIRLAACLAMHKPQDAPAFLPALDAQLPVYTVLVPLYREANMVQGLIASLDQLAYPRSRLDIKLILEADDTDTLAAVSQQNLSAPYDLVLVPPAAPRTKPKALNYALQFAKGDFVVIYDAEDRPHPDQLREALAAFMAGPDTLACVQAPLLIHNPRQSWLSQLFAAEYAGLFTILLPALARFRFILPLGGTSNHFRRPVLEAVGAWDPFNVTEDADLGIRMVRLGYTTGTITAPTQEEAPPHFTPWLMQRTRWMKGWMQTWLVHMRTPVAFFRTTGWRGALSFHIMITGMLLSALFHPIFWAAMLWDGFGPGGLFHQFQADSFPLHSLFVLNGLTLFLGYLAGYLLSAYGLRRAGEPVPYLRLCLIPIYWLAISLAAWRALLHLLLRPHHWEKTQHGFASEPARDGNA